MQQIGRFLTSRETSFLIPRPGTYSIEVGWLFKISQRPKQRLVFRINELPLGEVSIERPCVVEFFVPQPGELHIEFPDAARPIDLG